MKKLHEIGITNIKVESEKEHLNSSCSNDGNTGCSFLGDGTTSDLTYEERILVNYLSEIIIQAHLEKLGVNYERFKKSKGNYILSSFDKGTSGGRE